MTTIAEVDGSETKEDSDGATEMALVLEEVKAMLGTDLKPTTEAKLVLEKVKATLLKSEIIDIIHTK